MKFAGRNGVFVVLVLQCFVAALHSDTSNATINVHNGTAASDSLPGADNLPSPANMMMRGLEAPTTDAASEERPPSTRVLQREIHNLRRELDELKHETRQGRPGIRPLYDNPFLRIREMFNPFHKLQEAYHNYKRKAAAEPHDPSLQHTEQDQDPLSGGLGDDPSVDYEPATWDVYPPFPMMIGLPLFTFIGVVCVCGVMSPSWEPPATPPTRVGMPAWNTKTDAIFAACDRDRDGFLSYNDMRWMARVTNPEGASHFTFEWYKDLCRPLGVDPRRGFDKEEFRQSLMLLGNDVDSDYDVVTRVVSPQQQAPAPSSSTPDALRKDPKLEAGAIGACT